MILYDYLLVGLIFYVTLSVLRKSSFKDADIASVVRGLLFGVVLWPFALLYLLLGNNKKDE